MGRFEGAGGTPLSSGSERRSAAARALAGCAYRRGISGNQRSDFSGGRARFGWQRLSTSAAARKLRSQGAYRPGAVVICVPFLERLATGETEEDRQIMNPATRVLARFGRRATRATGTLKLL